MKKSIKKTYSYLPNFSKIYKSDWAVELKEILLKNKTLISELIKSYKNKEYTSAELDDFLLALGELDRSIEDYWGVISHLYSVLNDLTRRAEYQRCLSLVNDYYLKNISQNKKLFEIYKNFSTGKSYKSFSSVQKKIITDTLKSFTLSGIDLPTEEKKEFVSIKKKLAKLSTTFSNNVLDDTNNYELFIEDETKVQNIPEDALKEAHRLAKEKKINKGSKGWVFTLQYPSYIPFMKYCSDEKLREEMYKAFSMRASQGKTDNAQNIVEILNLRQNQSSLLDYQCYADVSLATKMAKNTKEVFGFLNQIKNKVYPIAKKELKELEKIKEKETNQKVLNPWDSAYYAEKLKKKQYTYDENEVKKYFPHTVVTQGLISIIKEIYGYTLVEEKANVWHKDVQFYTLYDSKKKVCGHIYVDLFARKNKRGGAWMNNCIDRYRRADSTVQVPVAYLVCNFSPLSSFGKERISLLTIEDVTTFFHEMGHVLHHVLTQIDHKQVSGINNVPWDGVELPSQFFENFVWNLKGIQKISGHYETKKPLPQNLFNRLKKIKNFQIGLFVLRQLEFGLIDMTLHSQYSVGKKQSSVQTYIDKIRKETSLLKVPKYNKFQNSFSHIFSGGYAAGYYSYLWALVLACEAFEVFEKKKIFSSQAGSSFLKSLLSQGGSEDFMKMVTHFLGKKPTSKAMLKSMGLVKQ